MVNEVIIWLNSKFPPLARWHEWLLVIALVVSAICTVELYVSGWNWLGVIPGLLWLRMLWRPLPPAGRARWTWGMTCGIWGIVLTGIAYIGVNHLL
jgi:hypothetical protein